MTPIYVIHIDYFIDIAHNLCHAHVTSLNNSAVNYRSISTIVVALCTLFTGVIYFYLSTQEHYSASMASSNTFRPRPSEASKSALRSFPNHFFSASLSSFVPSSFTLSHRAAFTKAPSPLAIARVFSSPTFFFHARANSRGENDESDARCTLRVDWE